MNTQKIPFPQANNVDKMISFLYLYAKKLNKTEIANQMGIHKRQVDYYLNSWKYLGVIKNKVNEIIDQNIEKILNANYSTQKDLIRNIMQNHIEIGKFILSDRIDKAKFNDVFKTYSVSTLERRLSTISSWKKWLG
jgi:DNA-binding transcriptional regulator LsrR (DeoR family)